MLSRYHPLHNAATFLSRSSKANQLFQLFFFPAMCLRLQIKLETLELILVRNLKSLNSYSMAWHVNHRLVVPILCIIYMMFSCKLFFADVGTITRLAGLLSKRPAQGEYDPVLPSLTMLPSYKFFFISLHWLLYVRALILSLGLYLKQNTPTYELTFLVKCKCAISSRTRGVLKQGKCEKFFRKQLLLNRRVAC